MNTEDAPVLIVGAGVAGLACALELQARGVGATILEAAEEPGGRVRTDRVEGHLLDRGFQVLLTAYPEARRLLEFGPLRLIAFEPGATIRRRGRWVTLADPFRRPTRALATLFAPLGSWGDKLRVARLRGELARRPLAELWARPESSTAEALVARGFSAEMIDGFFRPFLGGVFLERDLTTTSRMLEFVLKMFAAGDATIPADGIGAVPRQLAGRLAPGALESGRRVVAVAPGEVRVLGEEEPRRARAVVLATDLPAARALLGGRGTALALPAAAGHPDRAVTCLYFAAPAPPRRGAHLILNGDGPPAGPINNLHVVSEVVPGAAPPGRALVSASVLGLPEEDDATLAAAVLAQARTWFGPSVEGWDLLRVYRIAHALPALGVGAVRQPDLLETGPERRAPGLFVCGDWRHSPSLQGAMESGRGVAGAVADLLLHAPA